MDINLTEKAQRHIAELISIEEKFVPKFRVFVTGGGCSGFSYGFSFDEHPQEDDLILKQFVPGTGESFDVLIDPISFSYVEGATIDYKKDLDGERFVVNNPKASSTCSCGSSFSIDED